MVSPSNIDHEANGTLDQNNRFNPAGPNFQPKLSHSSSTALTTVTASEDFTSPSMRYSADISDLDYDIRKNSFEIAEVRNMAGNDIRLLQKKINQLTMKVERRPQHVLENITAGAYELDGTFAPSKLMRQVFTNDVISTAWLEDADTCDLLAARLRKRAYKLCPERELSNVKLIEAAPSALAADDTHGADFMCCKIEFLDVESMVEHVQSVHAKPQLVIVPESRPKTVAIKSDTEVEISGESREHDEAAPAISTTSPVWAPYAVSQMKKVSFPIPAATTTFALELLHEHFHGEQWSPGFWFVKVKSVLPSKSYWVLNTLEEPFLPASPGQHGAKLTPLFNDTLSNAGDAPDVENYKNVPLFIQSADPNDPGFRYFGNYSQLRYSDTVGYDTLMSQVPDSVRRYWAEQLSSRDRPSWVTKKLMEHFWPKPVYEGPVTNYDASDSTTHDRRVKRALEEYAEEVAEWKSEAEMKVSMLSEQNIFDAFAGADADEAPGLRLSWEYMECVAWDDKFYDMLVELKARDRRAFVDATGKKVNGPYSDTFKLTNVKAVRKVSPAPKNAGTDLCHPNGSARYAFGKNGIRQALPEHPDGSKPAVWIEKIKPAVPTGPKNGIVANGNHSAPHKQQKNSSMSGATSSVTDTKEPGQENGRSKKPLPPHMKGR